MNTQLILFGLGLSLTVHAQSSQKKPAPRQPVVDSLPGRVLDPVWVEGHRQTVTDALPDRRGTYLFAGKRSEVIPVTKLDLNVAQKSARQVFARIPGLFVYDMDGTGNQMNVATRGLDAHRSWELNNRQNGVITNSDMYGYPASHYSPPLESVERVELVRGTASLQYGAQFGGMMNYVTKQADTTRRFGFETINAAGSYGMLSTYNAVGGRVGKLTYYAYYYRRGQNGYRQNSRSDAEAQLASLRYQVTRQLSVTAELGRSTYRTRLPGPLTDAQFEQNPRQATRSRNYFSPDMYVPSVRVDGRLSDRTRFTATVSAVLGARNSVLIDAFATVRDTINAQTGQYRPRQVDQDRFNSYTAELRLLHQYRVAGIPATLAAGLQGMNNDLHRRQLGTGTTGTDYDLTLTRPFVRDLHYYTGNVAAFAESQFQLTSRLVVSPGIRVERGQTRMRGTIAYYDPATLPHTINHQFALLGINSQYRLSSDVRFYGGWSQAYRPVIFKDIIPASVYEQVDNNLKDAFGYNAEAGVDGRWRGLHINASVFELLYRNRLGTLVGTDPNGNPTVRRTNIGDSRSRGVELLVEGDLARWKRIVVSGFTSTAYIDARYLNAHVANGTDNALIKGNRVEAVPTWTSRSGLTVRHKTLSLTTQYSYVSRSFSDALNTPVPTGNGARGPVPAYGLWDVNATWRAGQRLTIRGSVNNLTNKQYFTKRPTFYPGPGIWPSDGCNGTITFGVKL